MDEKTVQSYANGKVLVKRRRNERYNPEKATAECQNTKNKVNLFGAVAYDGPNVIYTVSNNFNSKEFHQLIETKVVQITSPTVVLDNATIHPLGVKCFRILV